MEGGTERSRPTRRNAMQGTTRAEAREFAKAFARLPEILPIAVGHSAALVLVELPARPSDEAEPLVRPIRIDRRTSSSTSNLSAQDAAYAWLECAAASTFRWMTRHLASGYGQNAHPLKVEKMKRSALSNPCKSSVFHCQRRVPPLAMLFGLATAAAISLLPAQAQASCKGGFCVSGRDDHANGFHVVDFGGSYRNVTHYNLSDPAPRVGQLGKNETEFNINIKSFVPGQVITFGLQACSGGGFLQAWSI